ncbi:TerC/Alx family metal homeostasis membrane protein [Cystobacter fuscus]|nr:TerC/Alx family metal homeostasis membrane protein [Cystobacter fuscus]
MWPLQAISSFPGMQSNPVSPWEWGLFGVIVLGMIIVDLRSHRGTHAESRKAAYLWSGAWIAMGLGFAGFVAWRHGGVAAQEYLGAYLIEKSLSLDNLFVFLVIFSSLGVPEDHQRRVLFWGILGALVFRGVFIVVGLEALERWHWVVYGFGALLLVAAWRVARAPHGQQSGDNKLVTWLTRRLPVTRQAPDRAFFTRTKEGWRATTLFVALAAIELSDVAFAIDSVPAALSVSRNLFVVYTSNVFAILGLRALYIALASSAHELRYLRFGLAAVLTFAALKMILSEWIEVPPLPSVAVIVVCIGTAVGVSLRARHRDAHGDEPHGGHRGEARA